MAGNCLDSINIDKIDGIPSFHSILREITIDYNIIDKWNINIPLYNTPHSNIIIILF